MLCPIFPMDCDVNINNKSHRVSLVFFRTTNVKKSLINNIYLMFTVLLVYST